MHSDKNLPSHPFLPAFIAIYIDLLFSSLYNNCNTRWAETGVKSCCIWSTCLQTPLAAVYRRNCMELGASLLVSRLEARPWCNVQVRPPLWCPCGVWGYPSTAKQQQRISELQWTFVEHFWAFQSLLLIYLKENFILLCQLCVITQSPFTTWVNKY